MKLTGCPTSSELKIRGSIRPLPHSTSWRIAELSTRTTLPSFTLISIYSPIYLHIEFLSLRPIIFYQATQALQILVILKKEGDFAELNSKLWVVLVFPCIVHFSITMLQATRRNVAGSRHSKVKEFFKFTRRTRP